MSGPRYDLVPLVGAPPPPPAAAPAVADDTDQFMARRSTSYGWAALAIATLICAATFPVLIPVVWLIAALKRWVLPRLT